MVLTRHPRAARAKAALTRTANELLEQGADAIIDQAIAAAPSRRIAHTLQLAVEAASERVVIYRNGVRAELVLFAIPIITTFDQNVPESQFETALSSLDDLKDLARRSEKRQARACTDGTAAEAVPLGRPQHHAVVHGAKAWDPTRHGCGSPDSEWHSSMTRTRSLKRSAVFLRFLVGQRPTLGPDDGATGEAELCERLGNLTKQAIKHCLGLPCHVRAVHLGSFHETLYSGMWLYQETRLDQLARASYAQTRRNKRPQARVVTYGRGYRFEIWVGFFAGNTVIGGHVYRLGSRPNEDPRLCVARIASRLEAAGVKTIVVTNLIPEEMGIGIQTDGRRDFSMIAIPI